MSNYPYPSKRHVTYAKNGMVATSQPQAAQAGLDILKQGGNAIDAAIAVAAALTVLEPTSNGIGGDNFSLIWFEDKLYGLNASGPAPALLSKDALISKGLDEIPRFGLAPVTIPGGVAGWAEMSKRFGKLPFESLFSSAISYAKEGFPVSPTVSFYWERAFEIYNKHLKEPIYAHWFDTFAKNHQTPKPGEIVTFKEHAHTLELIAKTQGRAFYQGVLADQIDAFSQKHQGFIRKSDLKQYKPSWVEPISTNYRGFDVWEIPPNGQGIIALMALNICEHLSFEQKEHIDTYHKQIEATKLAFADGLAYIADPLHMTQSIDDMLSKHYAKTRASLISKHARRPVNGRPEDHGTVYLATADQFGNMVSMIQSNYMGFGSGIVIPHTGIALHNRGHNFSMDPKSVNVVSPDKKPYHTIIPGFLTKDGKGVGPFGVMGGFMQPQGHLQVIMSMVDFHLNPQAALDAPRFQWIKDFTVIVEPDLDPAIIKGLKAKGHDVRIETDLGQFGRGQIILRDLKTHVYCGGTEKRADGTIASY